MTGFFRAVQESPFLYRSTQLLSVCKNIHTLLNDDTLDMIRVSIATCLKNTGYSRQILNWYMEQSAPLSSNRLIHDLLIAFRNVLARVLIVDPQSYSSFENIWSMLMEHRTLPPPNPELHKNVKQLFVMSLGYYDDIRKFAEKSVQEGETWAPDAYMPEIMGTSLVRQFLEY
ncbi:hypothetical protein G6F56_013394 [Rhizopus delemar]|nr:hypothetical protein G6F56_013394 [Rhizopus delemar]